MRERGKRRQWEGVFKGEERNTNRRDKRLGEVKIQRKIKKKKSKPNSKERR